MAKVLDAHPYRTAMAVTGIGMLAFSFGLAAIAGDLAVVVPAFLLLMIPALPMTLGVTALTRRSERRSKSAPGVESLGKDRWGHPYIAADANGITFRRPTRNTLSWAEIEEVFVTGGRGDPGLYILTTDDRAIPIAISTSLDSIRNKKRREQLNAFVERALKLRTAPAAPAAAPAPVSVVEAAVFRPRWWQHSYSALDIAQALLVIIVVGAFVLRAPDQVPPVLAIAGVLTIPLLALRAWLIGRTALIVDADGIAARVGPRTRRFPWHGFRKAVAIEGTFGTARVALIGTDDQLTVPGQDQQLGAWSAGRAREIVTFVNAAHPRVDTLR